MCPPQKFSGFLTLSPHARPRPIKKNYAFPRHMHATHASAGRDEQTLLSRGRCTALATGTRSQGAVVRHETVASILKQSQIALPQRHLKFATSSLAVEAKQEGRAFGRSVGKWQLPAAARPRVNGRATLPSCASLRGSTGSCPTNVSAPAAMMVMVTMMSVVTE